MSSELRKFFGCKPREFWIDEVKHDGLQLVFTSPCVGCTHVREVIEISEAEIWAAEHEYEIKMGETPFEAGARWAIAKLGGSK